jgi:hypothetical protein
MPQVSHQHAAVSITMMNPAGCIPHTCREHGPEMERPGFTAGRGDGHTHGPGCGHTAVPHGDHVDYCVGDHLHHPHDGHCDDHGPIDHDA